MTHHTIETTHEREIEAPWPERDWTLTANLTISFTFSRGVRATHDDPGYPDEIECSGVWVAQGVRAPAWLDAWAEAWLADDGRGEAREIANDTGDYRDWRAG